MSDLVTRLKQAQLRLHAKMKRVPAEAKGDVLLDIRKVETLVKQVEMAEATLAEIVGRA